MRRSEDGQVTLLIIGLTLVLLMAAAVVVDASAAYLQRQALASLADGAALTGADLGAVGVYEEGVPEDRLLPEAPQVQAAVGDYLRSTHAFERYPGLRHEVRVESGSRTVEVTLWARVDLPLHLPGAPAHAEVSASSRAAVTVRR